MAALAYAYMGVFEVRGAAAAPSLLKLRGASSESRSKPVPSTWQSCGEGAEERLRARPAYDKRVGARPTAGRLDAGLEPDPRGRGSDPPLRRRVFDFDPNLIQARKERAALEEPAGAAGGARGELVARLGVALLAIRAARSEYAGYTHTEGAPAASNGSSAAALHPSLHGYAGRARPLGPGELPRPARRLARCRPLSTLAFSSRLPP
eukprot:tig00021105_g18255.t1